MGSHVDITMTAVLRPEIIKKTLDSFCENLFFNKDYKYRLIINIDPIGNEGAKPKKIVKLCKLYFDDVIFNIPDKASFPKAVIWGWKQIKSNYTFHLEDDWILNRKVELRRLIKMLEKNPKLACMRLYKHNIPNKKNPRLFNSPYNYKDGFFVGSDRKKQFGLNPVLIRSSYIHEALPLMVEDKNPEKQFRYGNKKMRDFVMKWQYAIYGKPGDKALVWGKNGLHWRQRSKYMKPRDGKPFLTWKDRTNE